MQILKFKYFNFSALLTSFLLGGVFFLSACKIVSGVKNPRWETEKTIQQRIEKYKLDISDFFMMLKASDIAKFYNQSTRKFLLIKVYESGGKMLVSTDEGRCLSYIENFVKKETNSVVEKFKETNDMEERNYSFINVSTKLSMQISERMNTRNNIFIYYGNFLGKRHFKYLKKIQDNAKRDSINITFINCDFREEWKDSIKFNLKPAK